MKEENISIIEEISDWDAEGKTSAVTFMIDNNKDDLLDIVSELHDLYDISIMQLNHFIAITLRKRNYK